MSDGHSVVMTTTDSAEAAETLARGIVEARLAGCVQVVGPITSVYRWEGEIRTDREFLCLVKTAADRVDPVTAHIKANHGYDVPEVVAVPVVAGSTDYLSWLTEETRPR